MDQLKQPQHQEIRTELLIEQYRSLREEIIQRVQARQQMWYVLLLMAGTFLTIGVQPGIAAWTVLLYPVMALFFAANWSHNNTRIDQITWYLQHEMEEPFQLPGWETYRTRTFRRTSRREQQPHPLALPGLLTFSARGVFLTTQLLALGIGMVRLVQVGLILPMLLSALVDLLATGATYALLSDRKADLLRRNEQNQSMIQEKTCKLRLSSRHDSGLKSGIGFDKNDTTASRANRDPSA